MLGLGNPEWGKYQDLVKAEIGDVSYFEFFRPEVRGIPIKMLDMYAQFVKDGFWIDLHLSKTSYTRADHPLFETIVKSAKYQPKEFRVPETTRAVADRWLKLWDAGKTAETFEQKSPLGNGKQTKEDWLIYWTAVRKPLGNVKTRTLAATESHSPPAGVSAELLTFQFITSFDNKEKVLETVALAKENGVWKVAFYISDFEPGSLPK